MKRFFALLTMVLVCGTAWGQAVKRPRITGISHVGFFVSDLPKALEFWHGLLGYDVYFETTRPDGSVRIAFVKINDHEHVELFTDPLTSPPSHMSHVCFAVDDIEAMAAYLRSQGYDVKDAHNKTKAGDYAFEIKDPDGMLVEFVQSLPDGVEAKAKGKFESADRVSTKIMHVGFLVGNAQKSIDFYGKVLGFEETWRGTPDPAELSWINMKVPDGTDYVEFMLYSKPQDEKAMGGKNHLSLIVPDAAAAVKSLEARPAFAQYGKPLEVHTGINRKRQVNLYDPDGTRVELMEPVTIDGKPTPPSPAPFPKPMHE